MASNQNKWNRPNSPPPPLFLNDKERDLVKQVNDELISRVIGQDLLYFAIDLAHTNFHSLYGEAIEKSFLPPIRIYALISWNGEETETRNGVTDRKSSITIHFHKRRLVEDQDLQVQTGDFVKYGSDYYEIVTLASPRELWGQTENKVEIVAECIKSREATFNAK